jgi:antitoxin component YwqK of YwqJK toxin-antitoxin module
MPSIRNAPCYNVEAFKAAKPSPAHVYHEELHLKQDIWAIPEAALVYLDRPGPKHYSVVADICKDYKYGLLHCYWTLDGKKDGPYYIYWHTDDRGYMYSKMNGYMSCFTAQHYRDDVLDGFSRMWDQYKKEIRSCSYESGVLEGECVFELDDTSIKGRCTYKAGLVDGPMELTFGKEPYGVLHYARGVLCDGTYTFTRSGDCYHDYCGFGACQHIDCARVNPDFVSCEHQRHHASCSKEFTIVNGRMEGEYVHMYPAGVVRERINYKAGVIDGVYETYHANGALESRVDWVDGHKAAGLWTVVDERGGVLKTYSTDERGALDGPAIDYKYDESQHTYKTIARIHYKAGLLHGDYYMEMDFHRKRHGHWYNISYSETMTYENGEAVGVYAHQAAGGSTIKVYLPAVPGGLHTVIQNFPEGWATSKIQYTARDFKRFVPLSNSIPIQQHYRFTETYDGFYYTWGREGELRSRSLYKKGDCLKTESFEWQKPAREPYEERLDDDDTVYDEDDQDDDW